MNIAPLMLARQQASPRPSWAAIFTKAYAMVARNRPELRRTYIGLPRPHLYEHPVSVVSIAIERRLKDEDAVLFAQIRGPENHTPEQIDSYMRKCKELPIASIGTFRRALREPLSAADPPAVLVAGPQLVRPYCARNVGTFGLSVYSGRGAESLL